MIILISSCAYSTEKDDAINDMAESITVYENEENTLLLPVFDKKAVFLQNKSFCPIIDCIEIDDYIIIYDSSNKISIYSALNGCLIREKNYSKHLFRIEKYNGKEGFDFRLLTNDSIIYLNSNNQKEELIINLPKNQYFEYSFAGEQHAYLYHENKNIYDMTEEYFVFFDSHGIVLIDLKNESQERILGNNDLNENVLNILSNITTEIAMENKFYYKNPRFIAENSKIVAGVFNEENTACGIIVFNVLSRNIEYGYFFSEPTEANYPIEDKYISIENSNGGILIDSTSLINKEIKFLTSMTDSYNYETFVSAYYNNDSFADYKGLNLFVYKNDDILNAIPLISVVDTSSEAYFKVTGDNYLIIEDKYCAWISCFKYTD